MYEDFICVATDVLLLAELQIVKRRNKAGVFPRYDLVIINLFLSFYFGAERFQKRGYR